MIVQWLTPVNDQEAKKHDQHTNAPSIVPNVNKQANKPPKYTHCK